MYESRRLRWLKTYERVKEYLKKEEMEPEGMGIPFNWIMDLINTAAKEFEKEERLPTKTKEEIKTIEKAKKELERGEFAGYPYHDESAEWGGGPEPEEPNPYHGTYSEE